MMLYNVMLLVHILGVLGVFIAAGIEHLVLWRMRSARTTQMVREWSLIIGWTDTLFVVSGLVILGAGLYMTITTWGWNQAWIDVSLGTLVLIATLGGGVNGSGFKAIGRAAASLPDGPLSAELRNLIYRPVLSLFTTITAFLTIGVVFLMTLKPDWPGALSIIAVSLIVAVGLGLAYSEVSGTPQIDRQAEPMAVGVDLTYAEASREPQADRQAEPIAVGLDLSYAEASHESQIGMQAEPTEAVPVAER